MRELRVGEGARERANERGRGSTGGDQGAVPRRMHAQPQGDPRTGALVGEEDLGLDADGESNALARGALEQRLGRHGGGEGGGGGGGGGWRVAGERLEARPPAPRRPTGWLDGSTRPHGPAPAGGRTGRARPVRTEHCTPNCLGPPRLPNALAVPPPALSTFLGTCSRARPGRRLVNIARPPPISIHACSPSPVARVPRAVERSVLVPHSAAQQNKALITTPTLNALILLPHTANAARPSLCSERGTDDLARHRAVTLMISSLHGAPDVSLLQARAETTKRRAALS